METPVEELIINITVNNKDAVQNLDEVTSAVQKLANTASSTGLERLSTVADNIKALAAASAKLQTASSNFDSIAESTKGLITSFRGLSTPNGTKSITAATTALRNLGDSAGGLAENSAGVKTMSESLTSMLQTVQALPSALEAFDKKGMGSFFNKGMDSYSQNVGKVVQNLSKGLEGVDTKSFDSVSRFASGLKKLSDISKDGDIGKNLSGLAGDVANFTQKLMNAIPDSVLDRFERLGQAMIGVKSIMGSMQSTTGGTGDIAQIGALPELLKTIGGNFQRIAMYGTAVAKVPFKMIFAPLKGVAGVVGGIANSFKRLLHSIGRVALMRGIRAAIRMITAGIKEGVDHLYLWASTVGNSFKPTMDSLASSFLYLKNSIGAAVSPLLDALAPALETVINKIVDVINIFNQAVATLTGASTWRKAIRSAADYSNNISGLGHDAEDANDSVKELKRTLLGFDEINRLDDKEKTTSKGSNGKDATGMYAQEGALSFTEVPVSKAVKDFVDMLKDAWGKADFTEIGSMIGNKIGTALLNVKWDKIQSSVKTLAKSIGTLINGALSYNSEGGKVMWDGIAYTIYNAINTAVLGYVTFFDTVEWDGIGEGIGAALKDVVENIHWDWMARALSAFPNAVIDAVNGFNKQFTADDFRKTGEAIGGTIADAIIGIKWADAFNGGLTLITGLIQAINGILIGFNDKWATIKDAILLGIASVPSDTWKGLGTSIGELIFNAGNFVANMVDLLFKILKEGKWASVLNGIWQGINDSIKTAYGGWSGAAVALGRWIMNNLDVIAIILEFSIASFAIKTSATYLAKELIKKINLLPTAEQGLTFGTWIKNIAFIAGIVLAIDTISSVLSTDFSNQDTLTSLRTAAGIGLKGALSGALIGLKIGGVKGALIGATVGFALTLSLSVLKAAFDQLDTDPGDFISKIAGGIIGAIAGLVLTGGNPVAGAIGFSIGVTLTLVIEELLTDFSKVNGTDLGGFGNGKLTGNIDWQQDNGNGTVTSKQNRTYGASNGITVGQTSTSQVMTFPVYPDTTKSDRWWDSIKTAWDRLVETHKASRFETMGVNNDSASWWMQLTAYWNTQSTRKKASRFYILGVYNEAASWWSQLTTYWETQTSKRKAGRFYITGVQNEASAWWDQLSTYWTSYTSKYASKLYASVSLDDGGYGLWNSFVSAWNKLQNYFDDNPLTAYVNTSTTSSSSSEPHLASGGVYKNGKWYPITDFASGGSAQLGQIFRARENGPELVGTLGGSTAVMNNDQIVASVSAGVYQAVSQAMGGNSGGSPIDITIKVDSETLYRSVKKGERKANGRYGTVVAVG